MSPRANAPIAGGAVADNLSQDRRHPTGDLTAPADAFDEELDKIDDLQLWPALAALLAPRVHRWVVQRNDSNAWTDGEGAALDAAASRVPIRVGVLRSYLLRKCAGIHNMSWPGARQATRPIFILRGEPPIMTTPRTICTFPREFSSFRRQGLS
jgi:hypothetical protein